MPAALNSYEEYARLIFSLLADRPTVQSHTLAVYTVSQAIGITRGQVVFRSACLSKSTLSPIASSSTSTRSPIRANCSGGMTLCLTPMCQSYKPLIPITSTLRRTSSTIVSQRQDFPSQLQIFLTSLTKSRQQWRDSTVSPLKTGILLQHQAQALGQVDARLVVEQPASDGDIGAEMRHATALGGAVQDIDPPTRRLRHQ